MHEKMYNKEPIDIGPIESKEILDARAKLYRQVYGTLVALGIVVVIMFVMVVRVSTVQEELRRGVETANANTEQNQQNGYKNRAVVCQIHNDLGGEPIDQACNLPEILQYYDPDAIPSAGGNSPGQIKNRELLCLILKNQGYEFPDCTSA